MPTLIILAIAAFGGLFGANVQLAVDEHAQEERTLELIKGGGNEVKVCLDNR